MCECFPYLYRLCPTRNVAINFCTSSSSSLNWHWNFSFKRNLSDREIQDYASLLELFDKMKEDRRLGSLEASEQYFFKSYLKWLTNDVSLADFLPSKMIWNASNPPKI